MWGGMGGHVVVGCGGWGAGPGLEWENQGGDGELPTQPAPPKE